MVLLQLPLHVRPAVLNGVQVPRLVQDSKLLLLQYLHHCLAPVAGGAVLHDGLHSVIDHDREQVLLHDQLLPLADNDLVLGQKVQASPAL